MTLDLTLASLVRASPMAWMELHGSVLDENRKIINAESDPPLRANFIQRKEEEVLEWMRANGMPGRVIKLKGRRQGSSTGTVARFAHRCRAATTNTLIVSLDEKKNGKVMRSMFDRFIETDRFEWGVTYNKSSGEFSNGSQVVHMTANSVNSGRGDGFQRVLMTEVAYYPDTPQRSADDLVASIFQCVPRKPDTEIVMESTPKGEGGKFHNTWKNAAHFDDLKAGRIPHKWNGFVKIFYPWHEHPDYTRPCSDAEAADIMALLSEREIELLDQFPATMTPGRLKWRREVLAGTDFEGDEDKFEVEYPSDEFTCFAGTGRKRFAWKALKAMMDVAPAGECMTAEWVGGSEEKAVLIPASEPDAWIRLWERPIHGCSYTLVVDPMTGEQATGPDPDNHAVGVWRNLYVDGNGRVHNRKLVARITDCGAELRERVEWSPCCRWDIDILTERIARVCRIYQCMLVVEMNMDVGIVTLVKAKYQWINLYMREVFNHQDQEVTDVIGWKTNPNGTGQRAAIIEALAVAVRQWFKEGTGITIPCRRVLHEMSRFVVKESGRAEAGSGAHDDTVMMSAIALATMDKGVPFFEPVAQIGPRRVEAPVDSSYY